MRTPRRTTRCCCVSFGGPERPDDVMPFLENVTAGRGIPRERLEEVGEHYFEFGGRSPINDQNRALHRRDRGPTSRANGVDAARLLGQPQLGPVPRRRDRADGGRRRHARRRRARPAPTPPTPAAGSTARTSPPPSTAVAGRAADRPAPALLQPPGLRRADGRRDPRRARGAARRRRGTARIWSSSPTRSRSHERQQRTRAAAPTWRSTGWSPPSRRAGRARTTGHRYPSELVYCSRSGPAAVPWLEPDVNDHLRALHAEGVPGRGRGPDRVRLRPHGGHLRPRHRGRGRPPQQLGLPFARAATAGADPRFVGHGPRPGARARRRRAAATPDERASARRPSPSGTSARPAAAPTRAAPKPALCGRLTWRRADGESAETLLELAAGRRPRRPARRWLHVECAPRGRSRSPQTKSSPTDVVTAMDRASEALIRRPAAGARPDDGVPRRGGRRRRGHLAA